MEEISDFSLSKYLIRGGLPLLYQSDSPAQDMKDYIQLYIKEEVQAEALVRNIGHFAKFLDSFGLVNGEEINLQSIANDSGVPVRTVASYIEVLKDTLLVFELHPFLKTKKRKASSKLKLYFFDVGVGTFMKGHLDFEEKSTAYGSAFEHFCLQEIRAAINYRQLQIKLPMQYWRSTGGDFKVNCILGNQFAIEIKSTNTFQESHLKGLRALKEEKLIKNYYLVTRDPIKRQVDGINVLSYQDFFKLIWSL